MTKGWGPVAMEARTWKIRGWDMKSSYRVGPGTWRVGTCEQARDGIWCQGGLNLVHGAVGPGCLKLGPEA